MIRIAQGFQTATLCAGLLAQGGFDARITSAERVMDRYYRGESLDEAVDRSNRAIQAYNAHVLALQDRAKTDRAHLERVLADVAEAQARLKALDQALKRTQAAGQGVTERQIEARNEQVRRINAASALARQATDAYNAMVARNAQELEQERKEVGAAQDRVNARLADHEAFSRSGQDSAFFRDLNQLLADLRKALRTSPGDAGLQAKLDTVRGIRRELAAWAMAAQARKPNGLVIVAATVGDEPCWFVVDTGAMDTIVSREIMEAIGQAGTLGKQTTLSVIGGVRVAGLACRIPSLTVVGQTLKEVRASVVQPSDVGIDGLLGQSFLKSFVYTIDERTPGKLILTRRIPLTSRP